jgi:hypothetical protein
MMKKYNVSVSEGIEKRFGLRRKRRGLGTMPEMIRVVLSDYFTKP